MASFAFTLRHESRVAELRSGVEVSEGFVPDFESNVGPPDLRFEQCDAIWDTGATHSVISAAVVESLGIEPIRDAENYTVGGRVHTYVYFVNFRLPNGVVFPGLEVVEGVIYGADVLIGMDVISHGDFAVTAGTQGQTWMSFSLPSQRRLDFEQESASREDSR